MYLRKISVYVENQIKHVNELFGQNETFLNIKLSETLCNQVAVKS